MEDNNIRFMISYFAQVRNMPSNILPVSTAVWNPKWWIKGKDKKGTYIGLSVKTLRPGSSCDGLCRGPEPDKRVCSGNPNECDFLKAYYNQLKQIDFNKFKEDCIKQAVELNNKLEIYTDVICFLVYEKYDNPCSERTVIKKWWKEHTNEELEEFTK